MAWSSQQAKRAREQKALQNPDFFTPHPNSMAARAVKEGKAKQLARARAEYAKEATEYERALTWLLTHGHA